MNFVRRHWLGLILLQALLVRLPMIGFNLWYDEAFTWTVSGLPLDRWWQAVAGDVHPPLFYFLEWLLSHVSRAPWVLRLLPITFGVLSVYLGVQVARALGATVPAQVGTALLLAFIPQQIYYSDELRMYSLLGALYLAAVWCVLRRRWGWWWLCLTAMLYTHHYGWLYAATLGGLALWTARDQWRRVLAAGAAAVVAYLPLAPTTLAQIAGTGSYWASLTPDGLPMVLVGWLCGYSFTLPWLSALLIIGALAVLMAVTWRAVVRHHVILLWLVYAPLLIGLGLALVKNVWLSRGFIGAGAMAAVLIAVELAATERSRLAALVMLGALLAFGGMHDQQRITVDERFNTPGIVAYLRRELRPGDVVVCLGAAAWMELQPHRLSAPVILDERGDYRHLGGLSVQTREALVVNPDVRSGRAWIFSASLSGYEPEPPMDAALISNWQSPELKFHSSLWLKENIYGNANR